eukprot:332963_1
MMEASLLPNAENLSVVMDKLDKDVVNKICIPFGIIILFSMVFGMVCIALTYISDDPYAMISAFTCLWLLALLIYNLIECWKVKTSPFYTNVLSNKSYIITSLILSFSCIFCGFNFYFLAVALPFTLLNE